LAKTCFFRAVGLYALVNKYNNFHFVMTNFFENVLYFGIFYVLAKMETEVTRKNAIIFYNIFIMKNDYKLYVYILSLLR